jgi:2-hydroxy-3-oxopropionate reductase
MVLIDNSTIKPETARKIAAELAQQGVDALDAPVSGGDVGAIAGTLAIMVGGPESAYERVLPVLQAIGKTITYVGESGAGQVAKACNQIMVAAQMVAMGELLLLAQRTGVDPRRVIDAIQGGAAQCWTLDVKPERLFTGNRQPGFKAHMMHKDLGIVLDTARAYGMPLPSTAVHTQLYESMLQLGMRDLDNSAVLAVYEKLIGEEFNTRAA